MIAVFFHLCLGLPSCLSHRGVSRASAAALSTLLRTTTLSYGNTQFSGTCPAETPKPIKMKFCVIDYSDVPKMVAIGWLEAAQQIGEI
jgi:hypothetical protein